MAHKGMHSLTNPSCPPWQHSSFPVPLPNITIVFISIFPGTDYINI